MLASGVLDETGKSMLAIAKAGAGAIVTKSVGMQPRAGHPNPSIVELEHGLRKIQGRKTSEIEGILGFKYSDEAIHRDNLVII